jgi:site-specific DNA-methyltransferase (adenine-specific)
LADFLEDPEIAAAPSAKEAMKILRKKQSAEHFYTLSSTAPASHSLHILHQGDVRVLLPREPDETFTCIIADPPYGVDADTFGEQAGNRHTYSDNEEVSRALYSFLSLESFRVASRQAHLYLFCDFRRFLELDLEYTLAGWKVWPFPLIWNKSGGMLPDPEHAPRRSYECILYANKGQKKVQFIASDVISISLVGTPRRGAEKPADLYIELLRRSTLPGDSVLDPFCGTGPIFTAASKLKLRATGIEIDPVAQGISLERISVPAPALGILDLA